MFVGISVQTVSYTRINYNCILGSKIHLINLTKTKNKHFVTIQQQQIT